MNCFAFNPGSAGRQTGMEIAENKGWYSRGYLPHYDQGGIYQAITYRLADSLPQEYLAVLRDRVNNKENIDIELERRKTIDKLLDQGHGSCILKHKKCADIIEGNWLHFNKKRYQLISYVIMPNHVHVLLKMHDDYEIGNIVKSWKSYSSRLINEYKSTIAFDVDKRLWQRGYWDRYIRDDKHFCRAVEYIKKNYDNGGVLLREFSSA